LRHENTILHRQLGTRMESLRFLIRDRDTKHTRTFDAVFHADDIDILKTPPQAPTANAHCEHVIDTLRREILDHILIMNTTHAHRILTEYAHHYNHHRPHQTRNQQPPETTFQPPRPPDHSRHQILRKRLLGGLINEYHHAA
jgi:putative transposase